MRETMQTAWTIYKLFITAYCLMLAVHFAINQ